MGWGTKDKRGISGAKPAPTPLISTPARPAQIVAIAALIVGSLSSCNAALAAADCASTPPAGSTAEATVGDHAGPLRSVSLRSALHGTVGTPGLASSPPSCHRSGSPLASMASALLPHSYVARPLIDGYSVSAASGNVAHEMRMEMNPRIANSGAALDGQSGLEARFGVRWQTMPGPAWVQSVPSWLVQDAKTYHRRGLPVLHIWESSNYLVALGLSNHGVPGVYFSQKLP
jgi:hypothetical protein